VAEQIKRALAVADALEAAADGPPEAVEHAHQIAVEIKREAAEPQPNPSRLKQLLLYAITAGVGALGQTAATDLVHLASQALQTF